MASIKRFLEWLEHIETARRWVAIGVPLLVTGIMAVLGALTGWIAWLTPWPVVSWIAFFLAIGLGITLAVCLIRLTEVFFREPARFVPQAIQTKIQRVNFGGLFAVEPHVTFDFLVRNATGWRVDINGIDLSVSCRGERCLSPPRLESKETLSLPTYETTLTVLQPVSNDMRDKIIAELTREKASTFFDLGGFNWCGIAYMPSHKHEFNDAWAQMRVTVKGPLHFDPTDPGSVNGLSSAENIMVRR